MARGATPEQAKAAGDSAALGTQRAVILGNTLGN